MEEVAEARLAVFSVLGRVEDVDVPHLVDLLRWHDALLRIHRAQLQESTVLLDEVINLIDRHARLTRLRVHELERDRLEVELIDESDYTVCIYRIHGNSLCWDFLRLQDVYIIP